jgi:hypothetical protein
MKNVSYMRRRVGCGLQLLVAGFAIATMRLPCLAGEPSLQPQLQALVDKHLKTIPGYRPGDLLSRRNVEPIFDELIDAGIQPVDNTEELYDVFLPDGGFLAQFSHTETGRVFLRQVNGLPDVYDRLERLSWMPLGRKWLSDMAASKDGVTQFKKLMTDEGLARVEKEFAADARGRNIRLPTGHIRTEQELLVRLERVVRAKLEKDREKGNKAKATAKLDKKQTAQAD